MASAGNPLIDVLKACVLAFSPSPQGWAVILAIIVPILLYSCWRLYRIDWGLRREEERLGQCMSGIAEAEEQQLRIVGIEQFQRWAPRETPTQRAWCTGCLGPSGQLECCPPRTSKQSRL